MSRPFRLLQVDHTGITVRDLDASLAFWCEVLGFELLYRAHRAGDFAAGVVGVPGAEILIAVVQGFGHKIELLQYLAPADRAAHAPRPCDLGSLHLCFIVDDLDAARETLAARSWTMDGTPRVMEGGTRPGARLVYLRDPDGTTIELVQLAAA